MNYKEVATTVHELKNFKGEEIFLLILDTESAKIEYVAATSILRLISYIRNWNLTHKVDIRKTMLIKGCVYLAEELPYDLKVDEIAYVIADDYDFIDFENMDACTEYIEEELNNLYEDIDKFIVVIGNELPIKQQHRIVKYISRSKKMEASNE